MTDYTIKARRSGARGADAKGPIGGAGLDKMADALILHEVNCMPLGQDFLIEGVL